MKDFFSRLFGKNIFAYDGGLMGILNTFGELVMLSVVFLICCIPVVTIGPAVTSMYYAVIKSVRRSRGTPLGEFFSSMKRITGKGIIITAELIFILVALYIGYRQATGLESDAGRIFISVYAVLFGLTMMMAVYIFPVLSRFNMKMLDMWKLAFVMSLRFIPVTAAVIAGTAALAWLQIYVLPIPCIMFLPGCWCYIITFMMEKALLHYMPKPKEGEDSWYYA